MGKERLRAFDGGGWKLLEETLSKSGVCRMSEMDVGVFCRDTLCLSLTWHQSTTVVFTPLSLGDDRRTGERSSRILKK